MENKNTIIRVLALVFLLAGGLGVSLGLMAGNIRSLLLNPEGGGRFVNALLDRPEAFGRFIHDRAVQQLIVYQEEKSFEEVPKILILLSFFDPDEFEEAFSLLIPRDRLAEDIQAKLANLDGFVSGKEQKLDLNISTEPYLSHVRSHLPDLLEMFLRIAPRCNEEQAAVFAANPQIKMGSGMPKCLPEEPHRERIKSQMTEKAKVVLAGVGDVLEIDQVLREKRGLSPEIIRDKLTFVKRAPAVVLLLSVGFLLAGGYFLGRGGTERLRFLGVTASMAGAGLLLVATLSLAWGMPPAALPLDLALSMTTSILLIQGGGLFMLGLGACGVATLMDS